MSDSFEVIDTIFAIDSHTERFWSDADPNKACEGVKRALQKKCEQPGGDAIQDCLFEYRVAFADGLLSKKQVMEIFAYGTVVKLK